MTNDQGVSVGFFAHTMAYLIGEYGDRVASKEFTKMISQLSDIETEYQRLPLKKDIMKASKD